MDTCKVLLHLTMSFFYTLESSRNERLDRTQFNRKSKTERFCRFVCLLCLLFLRFLSWCRLEGVSLTIAGSKFPSYRKFFHEKSDHLQSRAIAPIKARCPRQTLVNSETARLNYPASSQKNGFYVAVSGNFAAESKNRPNTLSL